MRTRLLLAPLLVLGSVAAACGDTGDNNEAQIKAVMTAVQAGEGASNAKAVVTHFTDAGLEAFYGSTREEILAPDYEFDEPGKLVSTKITVDGDKAVAVDDLRIGSGLFRVPLKFVHKDGDWLISGMGEVGAPPAPSGVPDVKITAVDYGFEVDTAKLATGQFRIAFHNAGNESHELALFQVPAGTSAKDGMAALGAVHGDSYDNVPAGYKVIDHLSFADPGGDGAYLLASPLKPVDYVFVCFLPKGGFDVKTDEPVDPNGAPHLTLGMYTPFTVAG